MVDPDGEARRVRTMRAALPLLALYERGDVDGLALALSASVEDPEDAGGVVYGLVVLAQMFLGLPAMTGPERLETLDGMLLDLAGHDAPPA